MIINLNVKSGLNHFILNVIADCLPCVCTYTGVEHCEVYMKLFQSPCLCLNLRLNIHVFYCLYPVFSGTDSPTTLAKIPYDELVLCYVPYGFDNLATFYKRKDRDNLKIDWNLNNIRLPTDLLYKHSQTRNLDGLIAQVINPKSEHF